MKKMILSAVLVSFVAAPALAEDEGAVTPATPVVTAAPVVAPAVAPVQVGVFGKAKNGVSFVALALKNKAGACGSWMKAHPYKTAAAVAVTAAVAVIVAKALANSTSDEDSEDCEF